jgi:hypothetical protein
LKKVVAVFLAVLSMTVLCVTFVPNVKGAPEDLTILSYSWYICPSTSTTGNPGDLIVVGEVQNVGPDNLYRINVQGTVYTSNGQAQATSYSPAYVDHMLPQQKAPFYMDFSALESYSGNLSWISLGIDHVAFRFFLANETDSYQYPDLKIVADTSYTDLTGVYTVTGILGNTGSQDTGRPWVEATYYNASGTVIAVGVSNFLTLSSSPLPSNQTIQFTVTPRDSTSQLAAQISSYSLLVQTENPIIPEFPSTAFLAIVLFAVTVVGAVFARQRMGKRLR